VPNRTLSSSLDFLGQEIKMKKIIDEVFIVARPISLGRDYDHRNKRCYHVGIKCDGERIKLFSCYDKKKAERKANHIAKQLGIKKVTKTGETYYGYDISYY